MKPITEEERQQVVKLYRNPSLTIQEIANIVGLSTVSVNHICRKKFADGTLRPRAEWRIGGSRQKKFTDEQLSEIAQDYYENKLKAKDAMTKYGLHPMQLQRIRTMFKAQYGERVSREKKPKEPKPPRGRAIVQYDAIGTQIKEYASIKEARKATGVHHSGIVHCCKGRYKTAGGFVWKYKETTNATAD